ncbi:thioredoxin family protein [Fusicatenibacter saccharivorans]|uniref:thioredoxin family protein n=1 Tax=Fusicatenibacter saccharivorans TaxID=1150298 RepID=UPI003D058BF3
MNIKVIGSGCDKCDKVYALVQEVVEELALEAEIEKVEDLIEIVKLGVMSAPSIMIDGKVVISGQVPTKEKIKKILERVML